MLSVAKLSPGQEAYYERSVADGIDDYYAGRGESPGVWVGRGAAELELDGVVNDGELGRLIGGKHPVTSAELRRHPPRKQITVERIDPATGERGVEVKTLSPVAGYDLVSRLRRASASCTRSAATTSGTRWTRHISLPGGRRSTISSNGRA
jgi:hypothetical protein